MTLVQTNPLHEQPVWVCTVNTQQHSLRLYTALCVWQASLPLRFSILPPHPNTLSLSLCLSLPVCLSLSPSVCLCLSLSSIRSTTASLSLQGEREGAGCSRTFPNFQQELELRHESPPFKASLGYTIRSYFMWGGLESVIER
jgi:hypothetical protein